MSGQGSKGQLYFPTTRGTEALTLVTVTGVKRKFVISIFPEYSACRHNEPVPDSCQKKDS